MSATIHTAAQNALNQNQVTQQKPSIHIEHPADSIHELLIQLLQAVDVTFGSSPIDLITQTLSINSELALVVSSELGLERSGYFNRTLEVLANEQLLQSIALNVVATVRVRTD